MDLVGDVGGTKVHLALIDKDRWIKEEKFPSRHYQNFSEILDQFLDRPVEKAVLACAGPVQDQKCAMTNLHWEIDADLLEKKHGISKVYLLNDLEAAAWGLSRLKSDEIVTLNSGKDRAGNQAVVAVGTGLGVAGIVWDGEKHRPFATEGGHVDFAPRNIQDKQLWGYLHKKYGHVSSERVVSGPGLEHLYWFMVEKIGSKEVLTGEEIPKLIIESSSHLCQEVVAWFAELMGAVCGNIALQFLAQGGLYIAGGIPPKILKVLKQGYFMKSFVDKGRFKDLLREIPVHVVLNESLSLLGAGEYQRRK